jgi:predicted DCC family thiol-disulfide oxidoreductase YuxK
MLTKEPRILNLPGPETLANADVVIWDGQCNFCRAQVERLHRMDSGKLTYLSLHDPRVKALCPDLSLDQLQEQMWLVTPDHRRYGGADAGRYLSRQLPKLWWLMPLLHLPFSMPLWRWIYRQIAVRRYKISGRHCGSSSCKIHE